MAITVVKQLVDKSMYQYKCPYAMTPQFIVIHNTANDASAMNEIKYMISNKNQVSFHYAIDDKQVVQGVPTNRNTWHSSDGVNGKGNRQGISIEICYSKSGGDKFTKAEKLTAKFVAELLKQYKWDISKVKKHQDFCTKYCPHRTLDLGWKRFLNMVQDELDTLNSFIQPFTNGRVKPLQSALNKDYKTKLDLDGWCGQATQTAMTKVNIKTYPNKGYNSYPNVVKFVQQYVGASVDGSFGPASLTKVKAYRKKYNLSNKEVIDKELLLTILQKGK